MTTPRYDVAGLQTWTTALFRAAGCDGTKPEVLAEGLIEADLLGHTTHGLQLAPAYLKELQFGTMTATGEPEVVAEKGAVSTWDGRRLPGVWLTAKAVDHACDRAAHFGMASVTIRRSHHIACLAVFLERATTRGFMVQIASSDPSVASVAPYGGRRAVFTPDPIAIGIPTEGEPILIDMSASITTNGLSDRLRREGRTFPGPWAMTPEGEPTTDPAVLFADPPGTLLPTGGLDHGHKGYGLALWIEALTQGLSGFGRADAPTGWGASVYVQVLDPDAFGGSTAFCRQTEWTAQACRATPPRDANQPVRLPGQQGLARKRAALAEGVQLYPGIIPALAPHAERLNLPMPHPLANA